MKVKFEEILVGEVFISSNRSFVKVDEETAEVISNVVESPFQFDADEEVFESPIY